MGSFACTPLHCCTPSVTVSGRSPRQDHPKRRARIYGSEAITNFLPPGTHDADGTPPSDERCWPPYHWLASPEIKSFAADFWNPRFDEIDVAMYNRFLEILRLSKRGVNGDEIGRILRMNNVRKYLLGVKLSFLSFLRREHDRLGSPEPSHKWIPLRLKPRGTPGDVWIQVPEPPLTYERIDSMIKKLPMGSPEPRLLDEFGFDSEGELRRERTNLFGFLLGAVVGDSAKALKGTKRFVSRRILLVLSKNKPNSFRFGEFTTLCANSSLGLGMRRVTDLPISDKRYGKTECYAWASVSSPLNSWIFNACLGLRDGETTTYDSLRMDWILGAPREFGANFIQGLSESDGWPDAGDDAVKVVSSPNTKLFMQLLENMGCPAQFVDQPPVELLRCRTEYAARLPFFSPRIHSNLYADLQILAHAKRYPERIRLPEAAAKTIRELSKTETSANRICLELARATGHKVSSHTARKYAEEGNPT